MGGAENCLYCHDEASLQDIAHEAGIAQPTGYTEPWVGRERLFLRFNRHPEGHGQPVGGEMLV